MGGACCGVVGRLVVPERQGNDFAPIVTLITSYHKLRITREALPIYRNCLLISACYCSDCDLCRHVQQRRIHSSPPIISVTLVTEAMMISSSLRVSALRSLRGRSLSRYFSTAFLNEYDNHIAERAALGVVGKPLSAAQVQDLIGELTADSVSKDDKAKLKDLLTQRVPPGVDEAAYVKATFLTSVSTSARNLYP